MKDSPLTTYIDLLRKLDGISPTLEIVIKVAGSDNPRDSFTRPSIMEQTKYSRNTVERAVSRLEELDFLTAKKMGGIVLYSLNFSKPSIAEFVRMYREEMDLPQSI